jgi:hypothetical protein
MMNKKQERILMLVKLNKDLCNIRHDSDNQTPKILEDNMLILEKRVKDILKLDGIVPIS